VVAGHGAPAVVAEDRGKLCGAGSGGSRERWPARGEGSRRELLRAGGRPQQEEGRLGASRRRWLTRGADASCLIRPTSFGSGRPTGEDLCWGDGRSARRERNVGARSHGQPTLWEIPPSDPVEAVGVASTGDGISGVCGGSLRRLRR
jgi:hypothetical protein